MPTASGSSRRLLSLVLLLSPLGGVVGQQAPGSCWEPPPALAPDPASSALGLRSLAAAGLTDRPPAIDGRLVEAAWCAAPSGTDFIQSSPAPGRLATLPSLVRVLYDESAVYVAVRLFDPHPDSIVAPYPRRDDENTSDWVFVEIDTRHDRRSGFSFGLNPRGVQVDGTWANDVDYDPAWNGVWSGAATIDSLGWSAEFRIPYSQLALAAAPVGGALTWGLNVYRYTPHRGESSNWSPRLPSVVGVVSHFNQLVGLHAPPRRADLELTPYSSVIGRPDGTMAPGASRLGGAVGLDARMHPTSSSAMALSLHPDFGQVEADPSQVNLTTFETFLPEQRPLFVEGAEVFPFNSGLTYSSRGTSFAEESPFYSRRIGRAPHGSLPAGSTGGILPTGTTLLGALRLSARNAGGWTAGLFNAWTAEERTAYRDAGGNPRRATVEPLTSFSTLRVSHTSENGSDAIGAMATMVGRWGMPSALDSVLDRRAFTGGVDARHRFGGGRYEASGFVLGSRVTGSGQALGLLRADPLHGYDRADAAGAVSPEADTLHTGLDGISAQAALNRLDGRFRWGVAGRLVSRGFESNDIGFQRNADWLLAVLNWKYLSYRPGRFIRRWSVGSTQLGAGWTLSGLRRSAITDLTLSADLRNYWGGSLSWGHEFPAADPEFLRGGPALFLPAQDRLGATIYTDTRRSAQATLSLHGLREPTTGSWQAGGSLDLTAFLTDRLQLGLSPGGEVARRDWQYVATTSDAMSGQSVYVLGRLAQSTASLITRATWAFSAHLTLQLYTQVFLSGGRYGRFSTVATGGQLGPTSAYAGPRALRGKTRVVPIDPSRLSYDSATATRQVAPGADGGFAFGNPDFSDREFHLNAVLRWEFRPGSTLFLVWTQQREAPAVYDFSVARDLGRLRDAPAVNVLQLKVSYRIGR